MSVLNEQDELIKNSWGRCRRFGLEHGTSPSLQKLNKGELNTIVSEHKALVSTTKNEVLPYYENILSNTKCLISLTSNKGQLLDRWGDQRFLSRNSKDFFTPGVSWEERYNGTNAIGTALTTGHAVQVQGDEHFLKANRFMVGSAAPIFNSKKETIGVLNVSSDAYLPQAHTFGLVKLMSQSVENRLINNTFHKDHFILSFNTNLENIDSPWSGMIVFDDKGMIVSANRRAELILGHDLTLTIVSNVFDCSIMQLKNQPENLPIPLNALGKYQMLGIIKRPLQTEIRVSDFRCAQASEALDNISLSRISFGDERMSKCIQQAKRIIEKEIPILIYGETGVGKEIFVKALHNNSSRKSQPLVAINCAAIPSDLVESELFGYEKGAFTGANIKGGIGLIRKAHKGTLFLDEIGEMPLTAQTRLLRVLQERKVTPLGSTESYAVDIKVISATNRSLKDDVEKGLFRQDLYYRVSGLNLEIPPLRNRTDRSDLFKAIHSLHRTPEQASQLSPAILTLFQQHPWPGNIRQLVSVIQIALAMADNEIINQEHLPDDFFEDIQLQHQQHDITESTKAHPTSQATQQDNIIAEYQANNGNISRTAKILGVSRNTLYKRLRDLEVI